MPAPTVQSLDEIIAQLNPTYDPQRQSINSTIQTTQANTQASQTGLDAAKAQAFNQITQQAQNRGMLFSGFSPNEQASYLGNKYLPASAQLQNNQALTLSKLNDQLTGIDATVRNQATTTQQGEQKDANDYEVEQQKLAQQLYLAQLSAQSSGSSGGLTAYQQAELQNKAASQYKVKALSSGNLAYTGPNGAPISAYTYAQATGNSLLDILKQSGSKYDQAAYKDAVYWLQKGGENLALSNLQKKYGKLF